MQDSLLPSINLKWHAARERLVGKYILGEIHTKSCQNSNLISKYETPVCTSQNSLPVAT